MENTMETIARYIEANYTSFGLSSPSDLKLVDNPAQSLPDGARWLVLLEESTVPDASLTVPFSISAVPQSAQRFKSKVKIECRTRNPDPVTYPDFFWDTARQMRDKVFTSLAGSQGDGLVLPRYDWTDPQNPVQAGEIWFEVSHPDSPLEESREGDTVHNKSICLTYLVHWWKTALLQTPEPCDPWLEALASWTENQLSAGWSIVRGDYPEVVARPAVVWKQKSAASKQLGASIYETTKEYSGNILGLIPNHHTAASLAIIQGLARTVKLPYEEGTIDKYLTVANTQVISSDDSKISAQLNVTLRQKTHIPAAPSPLMAAIHKDGFFT